MANVLELTPQEVKSQLAAAPGAKLIDVREPEEFRLARIEGADLIPMRSVPAELQRIEGMADDGPVMVICHHEVRSLQVVYWLRERGVENCFSVTGGIDRWSQEIDPAVPRY